MFWLLYICMSNIINTNGFVIQDTFNVLLKDDADYKVDLIITDDDHEMIQQNELTEFKIENEKKIFKKLDEPFCVTIGERLQNSLQFCKRSPTDCFIICSIARANYNYRTPKILTKIMKDPYEAILPMIVVHGKSNAVMTTYIGRLGPTTIRNNKRIIKEENDASYDYDSLLNEYYDEAMNESLSENAYHIRKSDIESIDYGIISSLKKIFTLTSGIANCSEVSGIGLLAVKCLLDDYKDQRQPMRDLMARLWRICQIWFLVYLVVAIPLWCTRGWCCCCLCCKFFKPRQTIEEAKKYVVAYPPGVFKSKQGEIRYEPSEREQQCYEEFEHFIKTL